MYELSSIVTYNFLMNAMTCICATGTFLGCYTIGKRFNLEKNSQKFFVLSKNELINNKKRDYYYFEDDFKDLIKKFEDKFRSTFAEIDMTNLYNKLYSCIIKKGSEKEFDFFHFAIRNYPGSYNVRKNKIISNANERCLFHELLHMASSYFDDANKNSFIGLEQYMPHNSDSLGRGLNEGYTDYLTSKLTPYNTDNSGYFIEVKIAKAVECIIGDSKMMNFYFNGDLYGLVTELNKYCDYNEIIKFLRDIDYISHHKYNNSDEKSFNQRLDNINTFLLKCFIKSDNSNLKNNMMNFINMIPSYFNEEDIYYKFNNNKINKVVNGEEYDRKRSI